MSELTDKLEQYINIYSDRLEPAKKLEAANHIRDLEANQRLIGAVRAAVAKLRHTKEPNKRLATEVNKQLELLPELPGTHNPVSPLRRYATYENSYGMLQLRLYERRTYLVDLDEDSNSFHHEETHVNISWWPEEGKSWEKFEESLNIADQADVLERLETEIESNIQTELSLANFRIHDLQQEIDSLRRKADKLIASLPVPAAATARSEPYFWNTPDLLTRLAYPSIWPPAPRR